MSNSPATQQSGQQPAPYVKAARVLNHFIEKEMSIDLQQDQDGIEGTLIGFWQFWSEEKAFEFRKVSKEYPGIAEYLNQLCKELDESEEETAELKPAAEPAIPADEPPARSVSERPEESPESRPPRQKAKPNHNVVTSLRALEVLFNVTIDPPPDISEFTKEQCDAELEENIVLLAPEDEKIVLERFPEDGAEVWEYLVSLRAAPTPEEILKEKPPEQERQHPKVERAKSADGLAKCKDKHLGPEEHDTKCQSCQDLAECTRLTLDRLTGIAVDVSKNLLHSEANAEEVAHDYGISKKELHKADGGLFLDWEFSSLREFIHDVANRYLNEWDESGSEEAQQGVRQLNPWTVYHLNRMVPEWGEHFKESSLVCIGPHKGLCHDCKWLDACKSNWLNWAVRIPLYITRLAMRDVSGNAFKVLVCIASHANWIPNDQHFGMCWLTYDQISKETNIRQPQHPIKELKEKGFIQHYQNVRNRNHEFTTTNCFTVNWFGHLRDLGVESYSRAPKQSRKKGV